jgi:hypothetical protein
MFDLGWLLGDSEPETWRLYGRAAARFSLPFMNGFVEQVELFKMSLRSAAVMFAIGQSLKGNVDFEHRTIFRSTWLFESRVGAAKQAIAFYEAQIQATKDAMRAWTQVGIRWKVVKDVRMLIAKLIWDSRQSALYKQIVV